MDTGMFFVPTDLGVQFPTCSPSVHLPGPVSPAFHPSDPPTPLTPFSALQHLQHHSRPQLQRCLEAPRPTASPEGLDFSSSAGRLFVSR